MYSSIYTLQSSTQRLPIQALFGFTLKATKSYSVPFPSEFVCVGSWSFGLGSPHSGPPGTCNRAGHIEINLCENLMILMKAELNSECIFNLMNLMVRRPKANLGQTTTLETLKGNG